MRHRWRACAALVFALLALTRTAAADEPPAATPAPSEGSHFGVWYGWQTLISDASAVLLFSIALADGGSAAGPAAVTGAVVYLAVPPIIHGFNGQGVVAGIDAGFRAGLPLTFGAVGFAVAPSCGADPNCVISPGFGYAALGGIIGMGAASVLDASLLAWKPKDAPRRDAAHARFSLRPLVKPMRGGAFAGATGTF